MRPAASPACGPSPQNRSARNAPRMRQLCLRSTSSAVGAVMVWGVARKNGAPAAATADRWQRASVSAESERACGQPRIAGSLNEKNHNGIGVNTSSAPDAVPTTAQAGAVACSNSVRRVNQDSDRLRVGMPGPVGKRQRTVLPSQANASTPGSAERTIVAVTQRSRGGEQLPSASCRDQGTRGCESLPRAAPRSTSGRDIDPELRCEIIRNGMEEYGKHRPACARFRRVSSTR